MFYKIATQNNFHVFADSFIKTEEIKFQKSSIKKFNWVFFSSKKAVSIFLKSYKIPNIIKIGAVSTQTKNEILKYGFSVDFVGNNSNTEQTGNEFAKIVKNKKVLFPIGLQSAKTIQKQLDDSTTFEEWNIYKTNLIFKKTAKTDFVIFTSPSNVQGYVKKNIWDLKTQVAIAIGKKTKLELEKYNIPSVCSLGFNQYTLADTLYILNHKTK